MTGGGPRWTVYRTQEAEEEFQVLTRKRKRDVKTVLKSLSDGLRAGESIELQDHPGVYRVHVPGRWRVLFTVETEARRIRVFRIRPRRTAYIGYERRRTR